MKKISISKLICKSLLAVLLFFCANIQLNAQAITNYTFAASNGTFTALSSPTATTWLSGDLDDNATNLIPIGFDFWYMGIRYTNVAASTNGWLSLGVTPTDYLYTNSLTGSGAPRPVIAPLWDDLDIAAYTNVTYKTTGTAGSRVFTLQYLNTKWYYLSLGSVISFQVKLYENTGKIEFVYRPELIAATSPSASIGITATATGSGNFLSVNNAGSNVSSTSEANITSKPASGKTYSFTPPVPTAPGNLTFTNVAQTAMTLNWLDQSSNENGFVIYRSTDGANYSFVSQSAAGATSSVQSSLTPGTTYYWKVYAVSEGALSTALSGSQATLSCTPIVSGIATESCVGGSTGTITASASGGGAPYTYSLNAGAYQSSTIFTGLAAATYTLNAKSNTGCVASTSVTVSDYATSTDNQNAVVNDSWIGHMYDGTNFSRYIGQFTEAETFDELFGGTATCFNVVSNSLTRSIYTETFSVKFRMASTKRGLYLVDLGSDDGSRLTVDGNMIYNNWSDQSFNTKPSVLMNLNGTSSLLYEFYENGGNNEVKFQNFTAVFGNTLSTNATQSICIGTIGSAISGDVFGTLPSGITMSGTGYQWSYSTTPGGTRTNIAGATSATFTPSAAVAPFNTAGTYYIYRNATLSSTNNVSPNPYVATNESNAATLIVTAIPSATISYAGTPYCSNAGTATVTRTGTAGGTYSAPAGLTIDAITGDINLSSSTAGTYTVTYTMAAVGGCSAQTATTSVAITALPSATIAYTGSPYIHNGGTATVTFSGTPGGTYSSTAGLSINASTGAIILGTSTIGTYTVTYTVAAAGGCAVYTTTTSVTIVVSTKTFTGTGNFSDATKWTDGTLPTVGENLIIDGACTVDNNASTDNIAYGTLTIGTATGRTLNWITGGTNRLNVSNISAGAGASTLSMANGGTLIIRGTWVSANLAFTAGTGTIEIQSNITLPTTYSSYNNLTINGAGATVKPGVATTINGNLVITAGTLNANNLNLSVKGNWLNNVSTAAFVGGTATVTFNGTTAQTIGGSFATTFTNLTLANTASTVTLLVNTSITGNLSVTNGTFDLGIYTANRATSGGTLSLSNNTILKIGGTNTFPTNFTTNTLVVASTVEYSGTNQAVANKTYGNLTLSSSSGAAIKTFPATALTIVGNLNSVQGAGTSVSFTATSDITVTGNVSIGASTTFNGSSYSHSIGGNWVNAGTFNGNTSTVTFNGPGKGISGSGTQNFNNLTIAASFITLPNSNITLTGNLATVSSGSLTQAVGGTLLLTGAGTTISGTGISLDNLTVSGTVSAATSLSLTGNLVVSGSFTASAGTITMNGTSKTISGAGTIGFAILSISGSIATASNFSVSVGLTVNGSFSASAGTATFTGTSSLSGTANLFNVTINGTSLQLTANSTLGIANTMTITSGILNVASSIPNTVNFNGAGAQTINAITYCNLTLSNANTKTAAGNITTNKNLTIGTGVTFILSSYTASIYGDWINNGIFTPGTSTVEFVGPATAYLTGATTFNILTSNTTNASTELILQDNVSATTVNMVNGIISTGSDTITITGTRTGNGFIFGNIKRAHAFTTGVAYAFEGPYNTITFSAVAGVTSITVSVVTEPVSDFPFGSAMGRYYNIAVPTGTYTATLRLHYEDDELNGNSEATMGLWNYDSIQWLPVGKTANDISANYVEQSGLTNITNRWTCSINPSVVIWNGSVSSDWNTAANWTVYVGAGSTPPSSSDVVVLGGVPFTYQPTISTAVNIKNLVFSSTQAVTLSMASGGSLVSSDMQGVWASPMRHTINVGNQTITVNGAFSLSDGVNGNAIDLNIGTGSVTVLGFLTQKGNANINFSGAGALNVHENFEYTSGTFNGGSGTVVYNGDENQHIAHVNYNNLTINKISGFASIDSSVTVGGNLLISAGQLENYSTINITGNVTISSGTTLHNNYMLHIGGNWVNNGTYVATGAHIIFNGTGTQTISATTFNNLIIDKPVGSNAILTGNVIINGDLSITSGTLDILSYSCDRVIQGGILTLGDSATLIVSGNNVPSHFTAVSIAASSTFIANGTTPQSISGDSFGNIIFRNAGLKTLASPIAVKGTLTIEAGASFDAGSQTITLNGNWVNNGTFIPSTSSLVCTGTAKTISGANTFNRVSIYGNYTLLNNTTFNSLLHITNTGYIYGDASINVIMNGDLINSGTLYSLGTTTFTGNVLQTLSLINATQTVAITVNFNGTVSPEMVSTSAPQFGYLNINNTGGVFPSVGWTVAYGLTVGSGASFHGGNSTHNILGNITNNGTITSNGTLNFVPSTPAAINLGTNFSSTGTVNFGGAGAITLSGSANSFHNVLISNTNAAGITSSASWNVDNNFTITGGSTFNAGNYSYTIGGNIANNGTINSGTSTFTLNGTSTQDIYSLSPFNNLTINKATDSITLSSNITANGTLNYILGTTNLNRLALNIPGTSTFTAGRINNGTVTSSGATSTFAGTVFGAKVNAASNALYLNGSTFNDTATLTKTGATDITSVGGNTFNGTTTISSSSTGFWILGNTSADIFNGNLTVNNTGTNALQVAFNAPGNQFNGDVTFNNTGTASGIFSSFGSLATANYNGNIIVNNTSTGGIYFGTSGGLTTLANTKAISIGSTGFTSGILQLAGFTQAGTTAQALTLTGNAALYAGPSSTFNGNVNFISPQVYLNGATYNGTASIRKSGTTQNNSLGGNVFVGAATIANSGSGIFQLGTSAIDIFNGLTLTNTGTGGIYPAYNIAGHQFNGNIILNQTTNSGIYFGAGTGTATLAAGKTITVGATGFSSGALNLARFTQLGATPQTLSFTGNALLQMGPAVVFNGNVDFAVPQLLLNGTTFNGTATLTKNGATTNTSDGGNIFNGVTILNCSGSGSLELGNTSPEVFNTNLTINNTGSARVQIGIGSTGNLFNGTTVINHGGNTPSLNTVIARNPGSTATFNGNLVLNCTNSNATSGIIISNEGDVTINGNITVSSTNGRGVLFSDAGGSTTLANGYTIADAGAGSFTTGILKLSRFTQTGTTPQNITLTGTASLQVGTTSVFNGAVNFIAPQIFLNGCEYNNTAVLRKTGATDNTSTGGNIFNGATTISNNGTGFLRLGGTTADDFNSDATFIQTGSGLVQPAYSTNCTIAGNLSTEGTATAITFRNTITLNGTGAQSITSSLPPTFTNLTILNTGTIVTPNVNVNIAGNLSINNGTLDLDAFTANRVTAGGTLTVFDGAKLKIGGTNTLPSDYTTHSIGATSTIEYSGINQAVAVLNSAQSYGHLIISGPGTEITAGTIAVRNNLSITAGSLNINTNTLKIGGSITNNGVFIATNGTIEMNGLSTQTIPAETFFENTISNLTINNTAGVTLGGALNITAILLASSGQLNTAGHLTLISTASQTALISGSGSGSVLGNVTMQRYLASGFGYKYFSSPFQAATVNEFGDDLNLYATFPSFYRHDENMPTLGWINYTAASGVLNPAQGYAANFGSSTVSKTVDVTGVVNNGTISTPTLYNHNQPYTQGFNLVGNPYPSPIDWDAPTGWTRTNVDNAVYYFNAGTTDQYKGTYSSYINGISSNGVAGNIIPSMQGFFVHVSNGTYPVAGGLTFTNSVRTNDLSPAFQSFARELVRVSASFDGEKASDAAVIYMENRARKNFDQKYDALKLINDNTAVPSLYAVANDAAKISIRAMAYPMDSVTTQPLGLKTEKDGWINFNAVDILNISPSLHIYLYDATENVYQDLRSNPHYRLQLKAGEHNNRFSIVFSKKGLNSTPTPTPTVDENIFHAYSSGGRIFVDSKLSNEKASLAIYNSIGQIVFKEEFYANGLHQTAARLVNGVYVINIIFNNKVYAKKLQVQN